jgi:hypothetical protein
MVYNGWKTVERCSTPKIETMFSSALVRKFLVEGHLLIYNEQLALRVIVKIQGMLHGHLAGPHRKNTSLGLADVDQQVHEICCSVHTKCVSWK